MEGCIVARHGPDDSNKRHEDSNPRRKIGAVVNVTPDLRAGGEPRKSLIWTVSGSWNENDDDDECDDVERTSVGVEGSDPFCGHGRDAAVDEHDEGREKEDLIILRNVVRTPDTDSCKNHSGEGIIDRWGAGDLSQPIRPASDPRGERAVSWWC